MKQVRTRIGDERGFTLILVLVLVVIIGLVLGMVGTTWKDFMQRTREEELFWRGDQYRRALKSFNEVKQGKGSQAFPAQLEDLVRDPRSPQVVRHLRRIYLDPMTGEDWDLVKDPSGRIIGVRSRSDLTPFRQSGFPKEYQNFEGRSKYSEWEFIYTPERKPQPVKGAPGGGVVPPPGGTKPAAGGAPLPGGTPHPVTGNP